MNSQISRLTTSPNQFIVKKKTYAHETYRSNPRPDIYTRNTLPSLKPDDDQGNPGRNVVFQ